jgi:hypothetical protein
MPIPQRLIRLSRAGTCRECGQGVPVGERAWWRPPQQFVTCLACRPSPNLGNSEGSQDATSAAAIDPGVAGGSAMREFHRRHDLRDARVRERWGRLGGLVLALTSDPSTTRVWERGSIGESTLAAVLGRIERDDVIALHDRRVPGTRGNIDHIVVSPRGVYVVDAKRYAGEVRVRDVADLFSRPDRRLFVGRRDCSQRAEAVGWQVDAVRSALGGRADLPVVPVLCFVDAEWPLFGAARDFDGVLIDDPRSLRKRLTKPGSLAVDEIREVAVVLSHALPAYTSSTA